MKDVQPTGKVFIYGILTLLLALLVACGATSPDANEAAAPAAPPASDHCAGGCANYRAATHRHALGSAPNRPG